jgi:hypothetical protein
MNWKKDDPGGKINKMAIFKIIILVTFILVSSHMNDVTPLPDFPQLWLGKQWTVDILEFRGNVTIWHELSPMSRTMYVVIPIFYILIFILWFFLIRRIRRKVLYVNGVKFGTVMWIHRYRRGHVYDLGCLLFNGGRHFKDPGDFPRPISGDFMKDHTVIYYRPAWIHHPVELFRLVVSECVIYTYGVQVITPLNDSKPINVYTNRMTDPLRPMIVYSDLRDQSTLTTEEMNLEDLHKTHVATQDQMIMNTWRMGRAEPNTALSVIAKSSYSVPDRTLARFWEKLPEKEQDRLRGEWGDD